jgi:hypothetical protein
MSIHDTGSSKAHVRIRFDLTVFGHDRTLQDARHRNRQLVGRISMKGLWQLGGLHHDLRVEVEK